MSVTPYRLERVVNDAQRLRGEAQLLATVFPATSRYTSEYLRWQYFANPDGDIVGFDAYDGDRLAAHYVVQPLEASLFGRRAKGVLSLNTATHPQHQGRGLFVRLASATYELARELGYEFVVGVANANSTPGFIKRLSFQFVAPLEAQIGIGAMDSSSLDAPDFERVWSDDARHWRLTSPTAQYRLSRGRLFSRTHLPFVQMQLATSAWPAERTTATAMPALMTAWIGLNPTRRWKGVALPVPRRMRPSPLNFIFRDLTGAARTLDPQNVVMDAAAFDAY